MPCAHKTVEWYRPLVTSQMLRVVVPCSLLVLVASILVGVGILRESEDAVAYTLVLVGFVLLIAGPTLAAYGVLRLVREDVYLSVRTDGVLYHDGAGVASLVAWDDLGGVCVHPDGGIALKRDAGPDLHIPEAFIGIDDVALAARLTDLQRRALMGIPLRSSV